MEKLKINRKDYALLDEVISVTKSCINLRRALFKIAAIMAKIIGYSKVVVVVQDEKSESLSIFASYGLTEDEANDDSFLLAGICGRVLRAGKVEVIIKTNENGLGSKVKKDDKEFKSVICAPIIFENRPYGCLLIERHYDVGVDMDKERELLSVVTSIISQRFRSFYNLQSVKQKFELQASLLKKELKNNYSFSHLVGKSEEIRDVFEQINHVSNSNATVLITGESGTGKELVAHAIHYNSMRANKPFVQVNCSALPESLIESELFGHEKGAFTDAIDRKIGRFELAHKGTLFLDEIGELKPHLQVKLLRAIQQKAFERVGGTKHVKTDVRIITATNANLEQSIKDGALREDFYYRINVFSINIPPLRDRKSDILLLTDHFVEKYSEENDKVITRIDPEVIKALNEYNWPGNVRELENCVERAVILSTDGIIRNRDLPETLQSVKARITNIELGEIALEETVSNFEKDLILSALEKTGGNKYRAAEILKSTNRIVGYKINKYGINVESFKSAALPC